MAKPICLQILEVVRDRLYAIRTTDGFNTDAGFCVNLGQQPINPDQLSATPQLSVYEIADQPNDEDANFCQDTIVSLSVVVEGIMQFGPETQTELLSLLWQDIIRAVFLTDNSLGGLALAMRRGGKRYVYPSAGQTSIAVQQPIDVVYLEPYGNP